MGQNPSKKCPECPECNVNELIKWHRVVILEGKGRRGRTPMENLVISNLLDKHDPDVLRTQTERVMKDYENWLVTNRKEAQEKGLKPFGPPPKKVSVPQPTSAPQPTSVPPPTSAPQVISETGSNIAVSQQPNTWNNTQLSGGVSEAVEQFRANYLRSAMGSKRATAILLIIVFLLMLLFK